MITRRMFNLYAVGLGLLPMLPKSAAAAETTLRIAIGFDDIRSLDPQMAVATSDIGIVANVFESLVKFPGGQLGSSDIQPALATSWQASDDKKEWTFQLREGVKWHKDHGDFTSEDVKFSFDRIKSDATGSPFRQTLDNVASVETDGPLTVRILLERPDAVFLQSVVNFQAGFIVSKKAVSEGENPGTDPIGTGPFYLDVYSPRSEVSLKRNEEYWGEKPALEAVVYQFMPQQATRELALRSGEVHAIELEGKQFVVDRVRQYGAVDITSIGAPTVLYINMHKKPFDDLKVRQALAHATDREGLVQFLGAEIATPEYSTTPTGYLGHIDDVKRYEYDVDKAKSLLSEAGHPNGFSTEVIISNSTLYLPIMQVLQEQWKKAGIDVKLNVVDHPTFHRLIRQDASPLVIYNADRHPGTAQNYFEQFYSGPAAIGKPTAITNFSHYGDGNEGIDALLDKARTSSEISEQMALWAEAQHKAADDLPSIPLYSLQSAFGRVENFEAQAPLGRLVYYMLGAPAGFR